MSLPLYVEVWSCTLSNAVASHTLRCVLCGTSVLLSLLCLTLTSEDQVRVKNSL